MLPQPKILFSRKDGEPRRLDPIKLVGRRKFWTDSWSLGVIAETMKLQEEEQTGNLLAENRVHGELKAVPAAGAHEGRDRPPPWRLTLDRS